MLDAYYFPHLLDNVVRHAEHGALLCLRAASRALRAEVDARLGRHLIATSAGVFSSLRGRHPSFAIFSPVQPLKHTRTLDIEGVPPHELLELVTHLPPSAVLRVRPSHELPSSAPPLPSTSAHVEWTCDLSACASVAPPPPLPRVRVDVRCGPRALRAAFHFPSADAYLVRFSGTPTLVSASILQFVLREMIKGGEWRILDTLALREMLGGWEDDVQVRIERALYDVVQDEPGTRASAVEEVIRRVRIVPSSEW